MSSVSNTLVKSLKVVTAAASNPIAQSEAKTHLRVTTSDEDAYITNLITAATQMAQNYTNSYFIDTTLRMNFSYFPEGEFRLYGGKINSLTHIKYYNDDNSLTTWSADNYSVNLDAEPCLITYSETSTLPNTYLRSDSVQATYVSGYGSSSSDVPMAIRQAILILIGHLYENRQEVVFGSPKVMPKASEWLLDPYRIVY